jgi:protein-S-isoprenylcysteine O-methyltransferase Ste14
MSALCEIQLHCTCHIEDYAEMKRILPPTLVLICVFTMLLLHWFFPGSWLLPYPLRLAGLVPLLLGISINVVADRQFSMLGTNVNTFKDPDRLVTDGLFKYSRNPMYLGFGLIVLGVWLLLGSLAPGAGVLVYFSVTDRWYIEFEESRLTEKFGSSYRSYQSRTRRWI